MISRDESILFRKDFRNRLLRSNRDPLRATTCFAGAMRAPVHRNKT